MSSEPVVRAYEAARDLEAVKRIWREIGWANEDDEAAYVEPFHEAGRTLIYELGGAAESSVHVVPGVMRYQDTDLRLSAVTAVCTSHVARRRGAAATLLARMLAEDAAGGSEVAGLGMFEQGFYDRLGFGALGYTHTFTFDPRSLRVDVRPRPPVRVTVDDYVDVHAAMAARLRGHGGTTLDDPILLKAELGWNSPPFGLGYRDADGALTHFVFGEAKGEHGPYRVSWMAYRDVSELMELLALLHTLADQVHAIEMREPRELQLQDLLDAPFREERRNTGTSTHEAAAWQQVRALDLGASVGAASLDAEPLRFQLELTDPIERHLPDDAPWRGLTGTYVVTLGPTSSCEPGEAADLPTLRASVGPFSRLLWGVRPATVLANSTDLEGPPDLLTALDRTIRLPEPRFGWDY